MEGKDSDHEKLANLHKTGKYAGSTRIAEIKRKCTRDRVKTGKRANAKREGKGVAVTTPWKRCEQKGGR